MMYYHWDKYGMMPSVFYNMPEKEKLVIRAFYDYKQRQESKKKNNLKDVPIFPVTIV